MAKGLLISRVNKLIAGPEKTVTIDITPEGSEEKTIIEYTYLRDKLTPRIEREMKEFMDNKRPGAMLTTFLATIGIRSNLVKWVETKENMSLPENDRKTILLDITSEKDLAEYVSIEAQGKIVEAVVESQSPNQNSSENTKEPF